MRPSSPSPGGVSNRWSRAIGIRIGSRFQSALAQAWAKLKGMRVFGIDCGTQCTGYGVVDLDEQGREARLVPISFGGIHLPRKDSLPARLALVHAELSRLIALFQPDVVAVEEVFHSVNAQSALKLGHVRGVALLAAAGLALPVVEYAPLKIKSSVVGYGLAKKEQVQFMVARLLGLPEPPEPADAADALAIAICHLHYAQTARNQAGDLGPGTAGEVSEDPMTDLHRTRIGSRSSLAMAAGDTAAIGYQFAPRSGLTAPAGSILQAAKVITKARQ